VKTVRSEKNEMLDEYILEKLETLSRQKERLSRELKQISAEEKAENDKISKLLSVDDVGKELFSPRGSNEPLKLQVGNIKKHIEDLLLREAEIQDNFETLTLEEDKYKEMLREARYKDPGSNEHADNEELIQNEVAKHRQDARNQEELEIVLKKLDKCIELSRTDSERCTSELNNLRYYLRALLSK